MQNKVEGRRLTELIVITVLGDDSKWRDMAMMRMILVGLEGDRTNIFFQSHFFYTEFDIILGKCIDKSVLENTWVLLLR